MAHALTTKAGNYLLRSSRSKEMIKFAILVDEGRIRRQDGMWTVRKNNGRWAGNCGWSAQMLINRYMTQINGNVLTLNNDGVAALVGAIAVSPWVSRTEILAQVDNTVTE